MTRPLRIEFAGAVYHLTLRGNAKQMIFLDEKDFADFLKRLRFGGKKISLPIACLLSDEQPNQASLK